MIRRSKSQVLQELPSKRRQKIQVEVDTRIIRELHSVLRDIDECDLKSIFSRISLPGSESKESRLNIMAAYKLTGLCKVKGINDFLNTLIENNMKFILFAHHIEVLDKIEEHIKKRKINMIRIDGSVTPTHRHDLVKKFQTDNSCRIALLSLTAIAQGITLTAASTVVFAEMNWTPGVMDQAEDRVHRIGQQNSVNIYYLYAEGTLDAVLYRMIKSKKEVLAQALNGQKTDYQIETACVYGRCKRTGRCKEEAAEPCADNMRVYKRNVIWEELLKKGKKSIM
eukprot:TRINITY_DN12646_c0_g1_i1.p1 TRINITY_DN12646_c0_g1~~TRINITY_DN12646_c0_g1_i1.p1  ORF type:complete len:282 (-),score=80.19 TRINITY_DN12646_c0_g1_i1:66-911(-)